MAPNDKKKKIYDETASLIVDLCVRSKIDTEEMNFLLNLLDMAFMHNTDSKLLEVLKLWIPGQKDMELDEIIKATLLAIDFNDQNSLNHAAELIRELVDEEI